eukprot:366565-Chlamydomonas_euryale.AAC.16
MLERVSMASANHTHGCMLAPHPPNPFREAKHPGAVRAGAAQPRPCSVHQRLLVAAAVAHAIAARTLGARLTLLQTAPQLPSGCSRAALRKQVAKRLPGAKTRMRHHSCRVCTLDALPLMPRVHSGGRACMHACMHGQLLLPKRYQYVAKGGGGELRQARRVDRFRSTNCCLALSLDSAVNHDNFASAGHTTCSPFRTVGAWRPAAPFPAPTQ